MSKPSSTQRLSEAAVLPKRLGARSPPAGTSPPAKAARGPPRAARSWRRTSASRRRRTVTRFCVAVRPCRSRSSSTTARASSTRTTAAPSRVVLFNHGEERRRRRQRPRRAADSRRPPRRPLEDRFESFRRPRAALAAFGQLDRRQGEANAAKINAGSIRDRSSRGGRPDSDVASLKAAPHPARRASPRSMARSRALVSRPTPAWRRAIDARRCLCARGIDLPATAPQALACPCNGLLNGRPL